MSEFENALQACLHDMEQGTSNVEDCLRRYPKHAAQLEPILLTSAYLARGRQAQISPAFQARVRQRLVKELYAHPRRTATRSYMFMRLAASLAVVILAVLSAGTAYAQRALPGESFYAWKIASENVWKMFSPDPVEVDLVLAGRRLDELIAVREDPTLQLQALGAYLEVADRLRSRLNAGNEARILAVLASQEEELDQLGILSEEETPVEVLPNIAPTLLPVVTPLPTSVIPPATPTGLPQVLPTTDVVPEILPTLPDPPKIVPTIEIPPPIP